MSTTVAARKPLAVRTPARSRPRLIVLSAPRSASKGPFVVLVGALLLAGLMSLLMLHTLAAQDSFRQTSLQQRLANLTDDEQRLQQQVQLDSAPSALRERAKALGMVPSVITHYRQLPNGRTVAREVAASLVAAPVVTTTTVTAKADTAHSASKQSASATSASATTTKHHGHHGAPQQ